MNQLPILPQWKDAPLLGDGTFTRLWYLFFQSQASFNALIQGIVSRGTHAERIATDPATIPDGAIFVESDRNGTVYQWDGLNWNYVSGAYSVTQSQVAGIGYSAKDVNSIVYVTDYGHFLQWQGSVFGWARVSAGAGKRRYSR